MSKLVAPLLSGGLGTVVIVLIIIFAIAIFGFFWHNYAGEIPPTGNFAGNTSGGTLVFPTGTSEEEMATCIDSYIKKKTPSSILIGHGQDFVAAGKAYNVNPAFLLAIARKESALGTVGTLITENTYNFFSLTTTTQPYIVINNHKFKVFGSLVEAINEEAAYLRRKYLSAGVDTIVKIAAIYAPPKDGNFRWPEEVTSFFTDFRKTCPSLIGANETATEFTSSSPSITKDGHAFPLARTTGYSDGFLDPRCGGTGSGKSHAHGGIDIMHKKDDPVEVYAVVDGIIFRAKTESRGARLRLRSTNENDHYNYFYTHLSKKIVNNGDKVKVGQLIGYSGGYNGGALGDHLHFGMMRGANSPAEIPVNCNASKAEKRRVANSLGTVDPYTSLKNWQK